MIWLLKNIKLLEWFNIHLRIEINDIEFDFQKNKTSTNKFLRI